MNREKYYRSLLEGDARELGCHQKILEEANTPFIQLGKEMKTLTHQKAAVRTFGLLGCDDSLRAVMPLGDEVGSEAMDIWIAFDRVQGMDCLGITKVDVASLFESQGVSDTLHQLFRTVHMSLVQFYLQESHVS